MWRTVSAAQVAMIVLVIAQQAVFSARQVERAPLFSHYPMYAATYDSPAEYTAERPPRYRIVVSTDRGTADLRCNPHEEFVRDFQAALEGSANAKTNVWRALNGCADDLSAVRSVSLEGELYAFDWDRFVFTTRPVATLGPLPADGNGITFTAH